MLCNIQCSTFAEAFIHLCRMEAGTDNCKLTMMFLWEVYEEDAYLLYPYNTLRNFILLQVWRRLSAYALRCSSVTTVEVYCSSAGWCQSS
jgi:hypothetical protein